MNLNKTCTKCKIEQPFSEFNKDKTHKDGHRSICKICIKIYQQNRNTLLNENKPIKNNPKLSKSEYQKKYYLNNANKIKNTSKQWYLSNLDKVKVIKDKYKLKKRLLDKVYRANNKEKRNEKERIRIANDPLYKLTTNIRKLIGRSFKNININKNYKSSEILGCSFIYFKQYIESKFEPWMTWENKGHWDGIPSELNHAWDIDHIIPLCSAKTEEDIIRLNHYTNLQPLCAYTNRWIKKNN